MLGFFAHTHAMTTEAMFAPYKSRVVSRGGLLRPLTYLPGTSLEKKLRVLDSLLIVKCIFTLYFADMCAMCWFVSGLRLQERERGQPCCRAGGGETMLLCHSQWEGGNNWHLTLILSKHILFIITSNTTLLDLFS